MVGWHHWLNGHEFEQVPGVGDGQGSLMCYSPWGHKELDMTERLSWTEVRKERMGFSGRWLRVLQGRGAAGEGLWSPALARIAQGPPGRQSAWLEPREPGGAWSWTRGGIDLPQISARLVPSCLCSEFKNPFLSETFQDHGHLHACA